MHILDVDRVGKIDRPSFQCQYFEPQLPVVLEEMAKDWPAVKNWTPEFFKSRYGDKPVKLFNEGFVKPGAQYMQGATTMHLSEYLDKVLVEEQDLRMFLYNIKSEMPDLIDDIALPDLADGFSKHFVFMFFGCQKSITQMHFDIDMSNVFHTVLRGKRTVTLFPLEQSENLHRFPFTCRSYVDVHAPDYQKYPKLEQAQGYQVSLEPGETLFMPAGYWHHVRYDEPGYALSLRCENAKFMGRMHGLYNLLVMQSIDRVMNKVAPSSWYNWKAKQAGVA